MLGHVAEIPPVTLAGIAGHVARISGHVRPEYSTASEDRVLMLPTRRSLWRFPGRLADALNKLPISQRGGKLKFATAVVREKGLNAVTA